MSENRCTDCHGDNDRAKIGLSTCTRCFQDSLRAKAPKSEKKTIVVADESPKKQKYRPAPKLSGGTIASGTVNPGKILPPMQMRYPRGVCQKCGDVLAKGSNSYCRLHERERLKAWRLKQKK